MLSCRAVGGPREQGANSCPAARGSSCMKSLGGLWLKTSASVSFILPHGEEGGGGPEKQGLGPEKRALGCVSPLLGCPLASASGGGRRLSQALISLARPDPAPHPPAAGLRPFQGDVLLLLSEDSRARGCFPSASRGVLARECLVLFAVLCPQRSLALPEPKAQRWALPPSISTAPDLLRMRLPWQSQLKKLGI